MPQKRANAHAQQRKGVQDGLDDFALPITAVEKRGIVTSYITLTPDNCIGQLTTIPPSSPVKDGSTSGDLQGKQVGDGGSGGGGGGNDDDLNSSPLPSVILAPSGSTTETVDPSAPLVAQTSEPTTTSSTLPSSTMLQTTAASSTTSATTASAASSTASAASSSSDSSNDAASKAGIALGVLGGLFVVLALVYFIIRRRRKQMEQQQRLASDDEKLNGPFEDSPATAARAPRLSLRPMTGLFTSLNAASHGEQQTSGSSSIALVAGPTGRRTPGTSAWERAPPSETDSAYSDPFGSSAERLQDEPGTPKKPMSPIMETSPQARSTQRGLGPAAGSAPRASALTSVSAVTMDSATLPSILTRELPPSPKDTDEVSPIGSDEVPVGSAFSSPVPTPAASFTATSSKTAAAALSAMERQPSERRQSVRREHVPAPLDLTLPPKLPAVPPSPAGTEFSFQEVDPEQSPIPSASAAAIAAAGGPANSTVHRVHLDYSPNLDDEMELQAGQLVRLLHEYDDGWALCIRLDRSEQGVVPRTCLSTRPLKPRTQPQGGSRGPPPVNVQGRPRGPSASSQRGPGSVHPLAPGGQRGPGYNRPVGPGGRPMGPGMGPGPRPQSPGAQRPQSPNAASTKHNPPGPSMMQQEYRPDDEGHSPSSLARKPVPGQAY